MDYTLLKINSVLVMLAGTLLFYNKAVNTNNLALEISSATGYTVMKTTPSDVLDGYLETKANHLCVSFFTILSQEDQDTVDQVVADHTP